MDGELVMEFTIKGKRLRKAVYWLFSIVALGLGAFCLYLGVTSENHVLAGFGVALGMVIVATGLAISLELTGLGNKLCSH